jgi:predicted RNase H-like nuclease (RuvC/YqgF family)
MGKYHTRLRAVPDTRPPVSNSNGAILGREAKIVRRDNTKFSLEAQLASLRDNQAKIIKSLKRAVRDNDDNQIVKLSGLLSNQTARIQHLADKLADLATLPIPEVKKLPNGARILPSLTMTYEHVCKAYGPVQRRWGTAYVNNGRLIKPKDEFII